MLVEMVSPASKLSPDAIRQQILLHRLYSVERDPLAVEVTRLSLIVKAAEEGSMEVPDLAENIKCGDALLGPDFSRASGGR